MGMIGSFIRLSEKELNEIKNDSELLESKAFAEDAFDADWMLDVDKSWEGLHYLLTGQSLADSEVDGYPDGIRSKIVFSNQFVDPEQDLGYGPAHYLTASQVKQADEELSKMNLEVLRKNIDWSDMQARNVYPQIWQESEGPEYLFENFTDLKEFVKKAAEENEALISFIC
ncbi:YfbM family protein [Marinoscillum pacificum]|uniref:YfbM family protein n=1 Tax=Marinoscillum pacificum TaxID=392723 RepID=UPI0021571A18|nr:YfbM family protein [Marinoscillum pacificum]